MRFCAILIACIHIYIYIIPNYLPGIGQEAMKISQYLFSTLPVLVLYCILYALLSTIPTSSAPFFLGLFAFGPHSSAFRSSLIVPAFPDGDFTVRDTYL